MRFLKASTPLKTDMRFLCGTFTKAELPTFLSRGVRHLHSTSSGKTDPLAEQSLHAIGEGTCAHYGWEVTAGATLYRVLRSEGRTSLISQIVTENDLPRTLQRPVSFALEELITNAIYHGYKQPTGGDKYPRKSSVELTDKEIVEVRIERREDGVALAVRDQGGTLKATDLEKVFNDCYASSEVTISSKDGGAGLGLYQVFEECTHLKMSIEQGVGTEVALWIVPRKVFDPKVFSFNFFDRR